MEKEECVFVSDFFFLPIVASAITHSRATEKRITLDVGNLFCNKTVTIYISRVFRPLSQSGRRPPRICVRGAIEVTLHCTVQRL